MTDEELVHHTLHGDDSAFTTLIDRHAPACLRFASRMLGSRDDAEDAVQESLVRAHRALTRYHPATAFRTWLFAIVVNRCRSMLAARSRRSRWFTAADDTTARARMQSHENRTAFRIELARALDAIPVDQREAFLLKHVEGLEYAEMAEMTGVGVSALKMRVQRACTRLQTELAAYAAPMPGGRTDA